MARTRPRGTEGSTWPLVGRADERALILDDLLASRPAVVVAGDAGVGKTRLAREAAAAATAAGHVAHWVTATQAARTLPFAAVAGLLPAALLVQPGHALISMVPEALAAPARAPSTVVVVDDAHLLDDQSAALVHAVAAHPGCFVIATVRTGEPAPDAVVALWKDGGGRRLELQAIARSEVQQLLERRLGGAVAPDTLERLWSVSRGNALYLRELVEANISAGTLVDRGEWRLVGEITMGARLLDLVAARVGGRPAAERNVLETLAVGEPVGLAMLESLAAAGTVTELERDGLVAVTADGLRSTVAFAHPLYAEAVRATLPQSQSRVLAGRLADALEATGARRVADLFRLADLRFASGGGSPALFLRAARQAWALGSGPAAERFARAAADRGDPREVPEARYLLGHALSDQGLFDEAMEVWSRIVPTSDESRAALAVSEATTLAYVRGDTKAALERLDAVLRELGSSPAAAQALAVRRTLETVSGRAAVGPAVAEAAAAVPSDTEAATRQRIAEFTAALLAGRPGDVLAGADHALAAAVAARDRHPMGPTWVSLLRFFALLLSGEPRQARELAEREARTEEAANVAIGGVWADATALVDLVRGRVGDASDRLAANRSLRAARDDGGLWINLLHLAAARAAAGDAEGARRHLDEARGCRPSIVPTLYPPERVEAAVLHAEGRAAKAAAAAVSWAREQQQAGIVLWAALGLHDAVRYGERQAVAELVELVTGTDGLLPVLADHADALAAADADALVGLAARFEALGFDLLASEAAAAAADGFSSRGLPMAAIGAQSTARRLSEACGVAFAPATSADPLTAREREVADLAAAGLEDRDIAARLFVSVRTVHAHLRSAYAKLGVSGRRELRPLASDRESVE